MGPERWFGIKDAFNVSPQCWQPYIPQFPNILRNSEDCLYLNIYTPARGGSVGLLPVMVWIHGGGYFLGSGSTYNGTRLARQGGVVVVTINYRLGVFGFLSTEDSAMPGNYGLLDQIEALKWVRDNIANFGGDPNSVTIFGESAGSSSVSLLIISPLAKGLFHRAIMESGVSLAPWGHVHPTQRLSPVYGARMIGKENGCDHVFGQSDSFLRCLRRIDAANLTNAGDEVSNIMESAWLLPRVENSFGVLPKAPIEMLAQGQFNHVDTVRGFNSHEIGAIKIRNNTVRVTSKEMFIEYTRNFLRPYALSHMDELLYMFTDTYLGSNNDPDYIERKAAEANSDFLFVGSILAELKMAASKSPGNTHYLYRFDYRDSFSTQPSWVHARHTDELKHIFGMDQLDLPFYGLDSAPKTLEDLTMTDRMMNLWTNFAKTGDPTSSYSVLTWSPFTATRQWMMNINTTTSVTEFSRPQIVKLYQRILQMFYGDVGLSSESIVG